MCVRSSGTVFSVAERPSIIDIAAFDPEGDRFPSSKSRRLLRLLDWIREALRPFNDPNFRWVRPRVCRVLYRVRVRVSCCVVCVCVSCVRTRAF